MYNFKTQTYKKTIYATTALIKRGWLDKKSLNNKYLIKRGVYYTPQRATRGVGTKNFLYK